MNVFTLICSFFCAKFTHTTMTMRAWAHRSVSSQFMRVCIRFIPMPYCHQTRHYELNASPLLFSWFFCVNTEHQHNEADSFCLQHHFQLHLKLTAISDGDDAVVDDSQYEFRFSISKERITKWTNERKHVKKQPVARRCVCASWQVRQKRKINDWAQEIMIMC